MTTPSTPSTPSTLFRNGVVHSVDNPFATAVLVTGGTVAWLGNEAGADAFGTGARVVDLDGALLTPAFADAVVDAGQDAGDLLARAAGLGVAALHVHRSAPREVATLAALTAGQDAPLAVPFLLRFLSGVDDAVTLTRADPGLAGIVAVDAQTPEEVRDHVLALHAAGCAGGVRAEDEESLEIAIGGFQLAAGSVGEDAIRSRGYRLEVGAQLRGLGPEAPSHLRAGVDRHRLTVVAHAGGPSEEPVWADLDLAGLVRTGGPLALGSGGGQMRDPWRTIAAAIEHPLEAARLTVLAAFAAHTRGVWRAGPVHPAGPQGRIAIGSAATLAVWRTGALLVQTPDEHAASSSTDPRAGIPALPALGAGERLPRCLLTMRDGHILYQA